MFVEVAVNLPPVKGTFHYHLPPQLHDRVRPGHLITAPFGPRRVQGIVINLADESPVPVTRAIEGLVDPDPVLTTPQLILARWLEEHTLTSLIECLTLMLPPGLSQQADSLYSLLDPQAQGDTPAQQRLIRLLARRGPLRGRQINRSMSRLPWRQAGEALLRQGILDRSSVLDPPRVSARRIRTARLALPPEQALERLEHLGRAGSQAALRRRAIIETLIQEREPLDVTWIYAESGGNSSDLRYLEDRDLVALGETEVWRDPLETMEFVLSEPPRLTPDQAAAWSSILATLQAPGGKPVRPLLLHGVTGSGKTELYLRAVQHVLDMGKNAIALVPEIALTPQTVRRFLARFPGQVGLIHSRLSNGERYDTWRRTRAGLIRVVVGARSALFAPMPHVGLIVVDESHDESYKEEGRAPRYHARETAMAYARILGAHCLLGSATPDVTTTYRCEQGELQRISLPNRILGHHERLSGQALRLGVSSRLYTPVGGDAEAIEMPPVRIVDMRQELKAGNRSIFSRALVLALAQTLENGHQGILFLNRRGTATYIFCRDCGSSVRCPRCDSPLIYHGAREKLVCHHCGYKRNPISTCPQCQGERVRHFGAGTQRLEKDIAGLFPGVRILRWDWDTTRTKGAHEIILAHFAAHRADILIGTQMVAKGLDLPLVTLVGVVSADTGLNLPDYRAAERTFQVLTQVAGRAGRGLLGGQVILQTYQPDHYAIQAAAGHDYQSFYQSEIRHRRDLGYPPFQRLVRLLFRHTNPDAAEKEARKLAAQIRNSIRNEGAKASLIGPAPCFFYRIRGTHRWHLVLRTARPTSLVPGVLPEGWSVDVDPVSLL